MGQIKVVVCNQKCPCCGRICGLEDQHPHHKCLYGHQMRGLNGSYLDRPNDVREASVIRCEQLSESDEMKYNGNLMTWIQFKDYWKNKPSDGWLYDDTTLANNQNQLRFESAWTVAGPIYCAKNGLKYVPFNSADKQKKEASACPVHYIFALDESRSMSGTRWTNLMRSLSETVNKIRQNDKNKNILKISIIKFASNATLYCENTNCN